MAKTIIENSIKVYKNHFCHCPCHQRIPVKKCHTRFGIPRFIHGHNNIENKFKKGVRINIDGEFKIGKDNLKYIDGCAKERINFKQRGKGFYPLNKKNKISNTMHHLSDNETVIFEPKELHDCCYHAGHVSNNKEQRKMADAIALMWYSIEWFHNHGIEIE